MIAQHFLILSNQSGIWQCPICNKALPFEVRPLGTTAAPVVRLNESCLRFLSFFGKLKFPPSFPTCSRNTVSAFFPPILYHVFNLFVFVFVQVKILYPYAYFPMARSSPLWMSPPVSDSLCLKLACIAGSNLTHGLQSLQRRRSNLTAVLQLSPTVCHFVTLAMTC